MRGDDGFLKELVDRLVPPASDLDATAASNLLERLIELFQALGDNHVRLRVPLPPVPKEEAKQARCKGIRQPPRRLAIMERHKGRVRGEEEPVVWHVAGLVSLPLPLDVESCGATGAAGRHVGHKALILGVVPESLQAIAPLRGGRLPDGVCHIAAKKIRLCVPNWD